MSQIDWPQDEQMLCVSIHDVAPATWTDCLRLVEAVRAVADIPLTWLVVPHYHFRPEQSPMMEACLNVALERGDELALHGYSHLDTEAGGGGLGARFLRNVYTRREGEFAALTEAEARRRLELGLDWFAARGWTPTGFVPPAWLLGEGAWRALRDAPFAYTTTFSHFHCLPGAREHCRAERRVERRVERQVERQVEREVDRQVDRPVDRKVGRPDRQQASHSTGDRRGYVGDHGASAQYGSGTVQKDQGNRSAHSNGSRQFDQGGWTGPAGADAWPDTLPDTLPDAKPDARPDARPDASASSVPHSPFAPNNRRGTHAILSPSLVYAARNRSGRFLSPRVADATAAMLADSPLVRFSLHPPDARYPELVRHIQHVLERLLERREAVTKAECARRITNQPANHLANELANHLASHRAGPPAVRDAGDPADRVTSTDPTSRPASNPDPSHSTQAAVQNVAGRTS